MSQRRSDKDHVRHAEDDPLPLNLEGQGGLSPLHLLYDVLSDAGAQGTEQNAALFM